MCRHVLLARTYVDRICELALFVHCLQRQGKGPGVMGGCEQLCGCWELNMGLLQKQQVLLTLKQSSSPTTHLQIQVLQILLQLEVGVISLPRKQRGKNQNKTVTNTKV